MHTQTDIKLLSRKSQYTHSPFNFYFSFSDHRCFLSLLIKKIIARVFYNQGNLTWALHKAAFYVAILYDAGGIVY